MWRTSGWFEAVQRILRTRTPPRPGTGNHQGSSRVILYLTTHMSHLSQGLAVILPAFLTMITTSRQTLQLAVTRTLQRYSRRQTGQPRLDVCLLVRLVGHEPMDRCNVTFERVHAPKA